jgi:hypothetical protein
MLTVDSIWRKHGMAWAVAGLASFACLQSFESTERGYSERRQVYRRYKIASVAYTQRVMGAGSTACQQAFKRSDPLELCPSCDKSQTHSTTVRLSTHQQ